VGSFRRGVTMGLAAVSSAALLLVAASGRSGHAARKTSQVHLTDPAGDVLLAGSTKSTDAKAKVDYPNATLTIRVANRRLDGNPAWMRVDDLETYSNEAAAHGTNDYSDNPFTTTTGSESTAHLVAPAR
jgi:hypothetical protein